MIAMKLDTSLLRSNESKDCNLQATYIPLPCHFASFDETNHFLDFINWKPLYGVAKKEVSNTRRRHPGNHLHHHHHHDVVVHCTYTMFLVVYVHLLFSCSKHYERS